MMHLFLEYYKHEKKKKTNETETEEESPTLIPVPLSSLVTISALKQAKCLENFSAKYVTKNFAITVGKHIEKKSHYAFFFKILNRIFNF